MNKQVHSCGLEEKFTSLATEFCSPEALAHIQVSTNPADDDRTVLVVTVVGPRACHSQNMPVLLISCASLP